MSECGGGAVMVNCEWGHDEFEWCEACGGCRECRTCCCADDREEEVELNFDEAEDVRHER